MLSSVLRGDPSKPTDAPLFRFNQQRPQLVAEVSKRVYRHYLTASRQDERGRLEYLLNETASQEIGRMKIDRGPEEEVRSIDWWRGLARRLNSMSEQEKRDVLRRLVESYSEDTAGNFDPAVYALATGALPLGLGFLFKGADIPQSVRDAGRGLRELGNISDRILIEGHVKTVRNLVNRGTVVFVPTHSSNMDSILIGYALYESGLPPATYGAGKNLFTNPLTSYFMHNLGAYRVDRRVQHDIYKTVLKTYSQVLIERGFHSLFFPGGTRCRSNRVENKLKLGLLGTSITAYTEHLKQHGKERPIFICPLTINYNLVLEAESLIREALRREGGARYFLENDEFNQLQTIVRFVINTMRMHTRTVLRFGEPMDCFGNRVDAQGRSYDEQGRHIAREPFVRNARTGEVCSDTARDRYYTRFVGSRIADSFERNTVVQPCNVVSMAAFELLRERFPGVDVFQLLRLYTDEIIEWRKLEASVGALVHQLRAHADNERLQLSSIVKEGSAADIMDKGVDTLTMYHVPSVVRIGPGGVSLHQLELLYFYKNRLRNFPIDVEAVRAGVMA